MDHHSRQHRASLHQSRNMAGHVGQLKQAPNWFGPNFSTENLSREQQYEMALSDCGYDPDQVQGYGEFKPGGLRYNPSKLYNLRVMDRQRGCRMLGVSVIGDTWTDPRTPAGRAMNAHYGNYLNYAGGTRVNEQLPPTYRPSKEKRYEQLAQQLGEEKIKQNAVTTLEKCQRYRDAIKLKTNDQCISEAEKNKYLAKGDKVDALISDLQKGLGHTKELPKIQESNVGKTAAVLVGAILTLGVEDLALLGLIATLCFQLHETLDDVSDAAIEDLLRDTGWSEAQRRDPPLARNPSPYRLGMGERTMTTSP